MAHYLIGQIERYCRVRTTLEDDDEDPFTTDEDGFLLAPPAHTSDLRPGAIVTPTIAARAGSLVLLGEPGAGKTTVFERLVDGWKSAGSQVVWVNAAGLVDANFDHEVSTHLESLPGEAATVPRPLTMVLDQIDESEMLNRLSHRLRMASRPATSRTIRFLVACRTAEYPAELTEALRSMCGDCTVADLAPLTRGQATALVIGHDYDPETLIAAAIDVGSGPLASVPLTLELLGRVYEKDGALPSRPADVFRRGVERLAEEPFEARVDTASSVPQRLAVAKRAAARMLLSNHRTLWRGLALDAGPLDLNVASLAAGNERLPGGVFEVTMPMVRETLRTALFTGRGEQRLAFRHSSIAAFLAAQHLVDLEVPHEQLRQIFMTSAQAGDSAIPWPLRETATWLVAIDPAHSQWLARADPESLAPHSVVVDSVALRALIVSGLLERAPALELSNRDWRRSRWNLRHAGLAAQLAPVFEATGGIEPQDWDSMARVRVAVRLAEGARAPELASPLLHIAEGDEWAPHTRRSAARAAYACSPAEAAPRLISLLKRFLDIAWATRTDPDDELRGELLDLLWPDHVPIGTVLNHLRPRRRTSLIGSYAMFLRVFAESISGRDVAEALSWGVRASSTAPSRSVENGPDVSVLQISDDDDPEDAPVGELDAVLADLLVGAALLDARAEEFIPDAAFLAWQRLRRHEPIDIPSALDEADPNVIPDEAQRDCIRREFAANLAIRLFESGGRSDLWQVIDGWRARSDFFFIDTDKHAAHRSRLLDGRDFIWLLEECEDASEPRRTVFGQLAAYVFDRSDTAAVNSAYARLGQPSWEFLEGYFAPVPLDSEMADLLRRGLRAQAPRTWEAAPQWRERLEELLRRLADGDIEVFWQVVHVLQVHPERGTQIDPEHKDDLFAFPGAVVLSADERCLIEGAMLPFLLRERDHSEEWIRSGTWDRRAQAGYVALCHLERSGRLRELGNDVWTSWAGSVIWFQQHDDEADRRRERILGALVDQLPELVSELLLQFARGELSRGRHLWTLHRIALPPAPQLLSAAACLCTEIVAALAGLPQEVEAQESDPGVPAGEVVDAVTLPRSAQAISAALDAWTHLTSYIATVDTHVFDAMFELALGAIGGETAAKTLASEAVAGALRADVRRQWPRLSALLSDPEVGKPVIRRLGWGRRDEFPMPEGLEVNLIAELYRWARAMLPPEEDRNIMEVHWIDDDEQARRWRDSLLRILVNRATDESIRLLSQLADEEPEHLAVRAALVAALETARLRGWRPPAADHLADLLQDGARRLVRSDHELARVVLESLRDIGVEIHRHGELLWNYVSGSTVIESGVIDSEPWVPKLEGALQAYFAHEFTHRLERRGVVVNREVLVTPTTPTGAGTRSDILIEAVDAKSSSHGPTRAAVVVEIKGNWNSEIQTGQRKQLASQYMPTLRAEAGVYLIAWFPLELWTVESHRRRAVPRTASDAVLAGLQDDASAIRQDFGLEVTPVIVTMPRPFRS